MTLCVMRVGETIGIAPPVVNYCFHIGRRTNSFTYIALIIGNKRNFLPKFDWTLLRHFEIYQGYISSDHCIFILHCVSEFFKKWPGRYGGVGFKEFNVIIC